MKKIPEMTKEVPLAVSVTKKNVVATAEKCENIGCSELKSEIHSKICQFRKVHCVILDCMKVGPFNGILNHVLKEHQVKESIQGVSEKNSAHLEITDECFKKTYHFKPVHLALDGKHFFLNMYRDHESTICMFFVNMIGTVKESKDYIYDLTLSSGSRVKYFSTYHIIYDTY